MGLNTKLAPLLACAKGKAPLCPWGSAFQCLHPSTWGVRRPAMDITILEVAGDRHLLRFGSKRNFWFPISMSPSEDLWSEYLVTSWSHRSNPHEYLKAGVRLGAGDVVLDCGACEGFFARQALDLGVSKVICIEPNVEMAACLEMTFSTEIAAGRLSIMAAALGALSGEARFSVSPGDAFSGRFDDAGEERVPLVTLDHIAASHGPATMIKMDLEGSEYEALKGGIGCLARFRPKLAITTYHQPWDHAVISSLIRGLGYRKSSTSSATMRDSPIPRPVMFLAWN